MGNYCNAYTDASGLSQSAREKGIIPSTVELAYFGGGKGRADPIEQMLGHHG